MRYLLYSYYITMHMNCSDRWLDCGNRTIALNRQKFKEKHEFSGKKASLKKTVTISALVCSVFSWWIWTSGMDYCVTHVHKVWLRLQRWRDSWNMSSLPGQSFPLPLCGPNSISRANAHMVYWLKHQHFTLHSITLFVLNTSATRPYVANTT